jgi:SAM-dependent methyltransferase
MNSDFWNQRYNIEGFFYGTEPNDFVQQVAPQLPSGPILCLAEGEGRNAVYLASLGHAVTAVDQSASGLAKARKLAAKRNLAIETTVADLAGFSIAPGAWSGIVAIFAHLPPELRRSVHHEVVSGLRPGGLYVLEAYTPDQLAFGTGGPKDPAMLMTLAELRNELAGLEFLIGREVVRKVVEGTGHTGRAATVQVLARRP